MRSYKVEYRHRCEKFACVTVEAENEKQAIDKVKNHDFNWENYDETESAESTHWNVAKDHGFYAWLKSIFSTEHL